MRELEVIARLRKAFPSSGIGDDAAVLPASEGELLFAADAAIESVHFDRRFCTLSQAVQKLVTSNVSDIFAMGGAPGSIVFTAGLPPGCSPGDVDGIIDGLKRACAQYGVSLVGGDTVASPHGYFFNVAIVGEVKRGRAVLRSGARVGDSLVLFGEIGRSRAGLSLLSALGGVASAELPRPRVAGFGEAAAKIAQALPSISIATSGSEIERMASDLAGLPHAGEILRAIQQHLVPLAVPLDPSLLDRETAGITAMIDVSDGLAKDLRTLCEESGVGAVVYEAALPVPPALADIFDLDERGFGDFALASGEEYVLLAAAAPETEAQLPPRAKVIGRIEPASAGIMLVGKNRKKRPLPKLGYAHAF